MPLFFFNISNSVGDLKPDGIELADVPAARREAIRTAGQIIAEANPDYQTGETWSMSVTDEDGESVCDLSFTAQAKRRG